MFREVTRLSLLTRLKREKIREKVQYFKGNREIQFDIGDIVYVKKIISPAKPTWHKAVIKDKLRVRTYLCKTLDEERLNMEKTCT